MRHEKFRLWCISGTSAHRLDPQPGTVDYRSSIATAVAQAAAAAQMQSLAWELMYAMGAAIKNKHIKKLDSRISDWPKGNKIIYFFDNMIIPGYLIQTKEDLKRNQTLICHFHHSYPVKLSQTQSNRCQMSSPVNFGEGGNPDQQRDEECCCLAAAGLSHSNDVTIL